MQALRDVGFSGDQAWALINCQIDIRAHMLAMNGYSYFSVFSFAIALRIIWFAKGPAKQPR